jgi:ParB family transcriptional regulator, chromosome partitioning protein
MSKMPNRPRLGRGLSALLSISEEPSPAPVMAEVPPAAQPDAKTSDASASSADPLGPVVQAAVAPPTPWRVVPVESIKPNPHQPRRTMNEATIAELAASLKANGLIQPVVVRAVDEGYQLIAGERRLRAAKVAGLSEIPALVREADAYAQAQMALVENIHREDLNPLERAVAYSELMTQLGLTQAELAARLGEQRSSVANYLRLLDLAESVRQLVRDGKLSLGHAKVLAGVADATEQERLAGLCVAQELSVRNLERLISTPKADPLPKAVPSAHLKDLETNLTREIGLRVQVRGAAKKGRLIIHYNNLDQFDELMKRLNVELEAM